MGKLLAFLKRNSIEVLFLLLQILAFAILVQSKQFPRSQWAHVTSEWSNRIMNVRGNIDSYFSLKEQNKLLQSENARLHSLIRRAYILDAPVYFPINDDILRQQYRYFPAQTVNRSFNKANNAILLDKGSKHGVYSGMAVIGPNGVVGIVKDVGIQYSSALTLLHSNFRLSVGMKKNDFYGTLQWDGRDYKYAHVTDFPPHIILEVGDTVVTDTRSSVFPSGIPVGEIVEFEHITTGDYVQAKVRIFTDFTSLGAVYMVEDVFRSEREEMEKLLNRGNE
jgi:rod shape-determining protein MreC